MLRGTYCPGHDPRIPCRRPPSNHSGVTPGTQGIHMTQNPYYSVGKDDLIREYLERKIPVSVIARLLNVPFRQPCLTSRLLYDYAAWFCNCNSTNVIDQL